MGQFPEHLLHIFLPKLDLFQHLQSAQLILLYCLLPIFLSRLLQLFYLVGPCLYGLLDPTTVTLCIAEAHDFCLYGAGEGFGDGVVDNIDHDLVMVAVELQLAMGIFQLLQQFSFNLLGPFILHLNQSASVFLLAHHPDFEGLSCLPLVPIEGLIHPRVIGNPAPLQAANRHLLR